MEKVVQQIQTHKDRRRRRIAILKEKKKLMKRRKKELVRCTCTQRNQPQKQVSSNSYLNLMENDSERNSWLLLHGEAREIARDVWDLGKDFGLMHKGEEGEILQELVVGVKGGEGSSKHN
jgi:hypothetical protein